MIDFIVYFKNESDVESSFVQTIVFDEDKWNNIILPELTNFILNL